ncbi:MAG TPA: D-alanyl-D-alanine carboxypeptidase/D-alanyl-D-alanine-endopeptidase [Casimicrobiaceae bacterium]|nr:D-alanyl-D-alanine carboxypeptidase/D-alanyl-D-alanine-endopeptidase [Casimicrobiaceae bacterium]
MKRALALLLLMAAHAAHAELPRAVGRAFLDAGIPLNRVAIAVQEVRAPRPLFAYDAERAMSPASVMKLVTTFVALELLGPDYRWRTEAYADGRLDSGVLHGDLVLRGRGDPKITVEQWQSFMTRLRAAGLDSIDGQLVLDRTAFDVPAHDPAAFDGEPLKPYNVGPDALLVNFKAADLVFAPDATTGRAQVRLDPPLAPVSVAAPPLDGAPCGDWRAALRPQFDDDGRAVQVSFAGSYPASCGERDWWVALLDAPHYTHAMFTLYFRAAGGQFAGGLAERRAPPAAAPLAVLESPPLYDIVRDVNKFSNNVMARQIFLTLALEAAPPPATTAKAADVVRRFFALRKIALPKLVIENGSGLSRNERITAGGLVRLLMAADRSAVRDDFASSLAVAAMDGTVERRFLAGPAAGQALLKTGSLEGVRALAGYVLDAQGHRYAVAAIINHPNAARGGPALDNLVQWVYANAATWDPRVGR